MGRRRDRDRGVLSISLALVFPAVLLLILMVVQASLVWYAREVALAGARAGADAGRSYGLSRGDAEKSATDRADAFLARFTGVIGKPTVETPVFTATTVTVTVHVTPLYLVFDFGDMSQSASAPIERYVAP